MALSFVVYDLVFMVLFGILAFFYFKKHKENVKRHGWIFLYHSQVGIKFIDWFAKKFEKVLKPLSYFVIGLGYVLMAAMLWLLSKSVWVYISTPIPEQLQNLPPIAPLIPYFPKLFGLESLFPPLYFTYFLIALAIVAVSHEFSHGIFARLWKIKVLTTGLAFFGPFFGAFVEPDEKKMAKAPKFQQLSILGAGVFANVLMTILFALIMWGFFVVSFAPAGVVFNSYAQAVVNVSGISEVEGNNVTDIFEISKYTKEGLNEINVYGSKFLAPQELLKSENLLENEQIIVFDNAPAVRSNLQGAISKIDGNNIRNHEDLVNVLGALNPGSEIEVVTIQEDGSFIKYDITLAERNGNAYLGVGFYERNREGFSGKLFSLFTKIKDPRVFYQPSWDGDFVIFIYDLLWWIVVINILVALFNMLPVSIVDGGRFFYLTVAGIFGSEKSGKRAHKIATWFIVMLLVIMMTRWIFGFIS
jgi:membrane-associated protease RseP (regulator of RpoE activity)